MARLTILMGAPGSGKSTYAAAGAVPGEVVSSEGARVDPKASGDVMRAGFRRVHELLAAGEDVVFDSTAAKPSMRAALRGIARKYGAPVDVHVFDTEVEACVEAQRNRAHPVPEDVVRRYHASVRRQLPGLASEGFGSVKIMRREP
jgi:predicted kinase